MCKDIGVPEKNILRLKDPDAKLYKSKLKEMEKRIKAKHKDKGPECIVWVHYAGHGAMQNESYVILNQDFDRFQGLENWCSMIGSYKKISCYAFFDCCRESKSPEDILKYSAKNMKNFQATQALTEGANITQDMRNASAAERLEREK